MYQLLRNRLFPLSHFFHVAKTFVFEVLKRYLPFPPEVKFVPDTIMLDLNDVSKRRCKHLFFAVVSILKGTDKALPHNVSGVTALFHTQNK